MNENLDITTAEQNLCDNVKSLFEPTANFETAELYLSTEEFFRMVLQIVPSNISIERFQLLIQYAEFFPTFNEFNNKHYWLLHKKRDYFS